MTAPPVWKLLLIKTVMVSIGLCFSGLALLKLLIDTIRKRGANLRTVPRQEPEVLKSEEWGKHKTVRANGIDFHYVIKGQGPLMLMLHGFPELWYSWRHQITEFSKTHTVVAVDLRGYNLSSKPTKTSDYNIDQLVLDVVELIKALGYHNCVLVAHDWGGMIAWSLAIQYPEYVNKLIIMNCPHPIGFKKNASFKQFLMSWYFFLFQVPYLPELLISSNDYQLISAIFKGTLSKAETEPYKYAAALPGALTAQIAYHRNVAYAFAQKPAGVKVTMPTLVIWGEKDKFLGKGLLTGLDRCVPQLTLKFIPEGSHWINQHFPNEVNAEMRKFLQ